MLIHHPSLKQSTKIIVKNYLQRIIPTVHPTEITLFAKPYITTVINCINLLKLTRRSVLTIKQPKLEVYLTWRFCHELDNVDLKTKYQNKENFNNWI